MCLSRRHLGEVVGMNALAAGIFSEAGQFTRDQGASQTMTITFAAGTIVDNRYALVKELGAGGMGTVYFARELELDRMVALKILHATLQGDEVNRRRFAREGKALASLSHAHILQLYRFGSWQGQWLYIAMEFIEGHSLREELSDGTQMPVDRCTKIAKQICDAMEVAHKRGIVHRDISPGNVMLLSGSDDFVKVIDFGLSMFTSRDTASELKLTNTGMLIGSLYYMSPEQCNGARADHRSDIYSVGCVLYQMVAGCTPFDASNPIALMRQHTSEAPRPLSTLRTEPLPAGLENVISRAMAKQPEDRYQSMSDFNRDLELVVCGNGAVIESVLSDKRSSRRGGSPGITRGVIIAAVAICLLFALVPAIHKYRNDGDPFSDRKADAATLRRLRREDTMNTWTDAQRRDYYLSWIANYARESDSTLDSVNAYRRLSYAVERAAPLQARQYRETALRMCQRLLESSTARREGTVTDSVAQELVRILTDIGDPAVFIRTLRTCVANMESGGETGVVQALCTLRSELGTALVKSGNYSEALQSYEEVLLSTDRCSVIAMDRLNTMVCVCDCLWKLNRKSQARKQLIAASEFAFRSVPDRMATKEILIKRSIIQEQPEFCLELCDRVRSFNDLSKDRQAMQRINCYKVDALQKLGRPLDAFKVAKAALPLAPSVADWFELWLRLNFINATSDVHEAKFLVEQLNQVIKQLYDTHRMTDIYSLHRVLEQAIHLYSETKDYDSARALFDSVAILRQRWVAKDIPHIFQPATGFAVALRATGNCVESENLMRALRRAQSPAELGTRVDLTISQFLTGELFLNGKSAEALKLMDEFIREAAEKEQGNCVCSMMLSKARYIGRELKQPARGNQMLDEVLKVARDRSSSMTMNEDEYFRLCDEVAVDHGILAYYDSNYKKAIDILNSSCNTIRFRGIRERGLLWLARAYEADKQLPRARAVMEQYVRLYNADQAPADYRVTLKSYMEFCRRTNDCTRLQSLQREFDAAVQAHPYVGVKF